MAQGNPRPRHGRNPSRILRLAGRANIGSDEDITTAKPTGNQNETVRYIKRVLCASNSQKAAFGGQQDSRPLEELLPPLTSSNEVDLQLYAIIAVILSNFVQTWYNRITPDQDFVAEVVQIIAHCTRGLEQRLRHVDLEDLLLDEVPALMISHIDAVRVAHNAHSGARETHDIRLIYRSIHPNEALTPLPNTPEAEVEQKENEIAWSQLLVSRILPLVLPPEDLQNPCLHVLVSEIFSEMIVHRVLCQRVTEPWLLWESVAKVICVLRPDLVKRPPPKSPEVPSPGSRLEQFGLLSSKEAATSHDGRLSKPGRFDSLAGAFWAALQFSTIAWLFLRSFVLALMHASTLPARSSHAENGKTSDKPAATAVDPSVDGAAPQPQITRNNHGRKRPVVRMRVWTCISRLTALDDRMPWLSGLLSLLQWLSLQGPGQVGRTDSALDRVLSAQIQAKLLRPTYLPTLLQAARSAIFPDNSLAEARVAPTAEQVGEIKRVCAETVVAAVPPVMRERFFTTTDEDAMREDVEGTLDLFADQYLNKHLIMSVVELLTVRLFPELSEEDGGTD